MGCTQAGLLEPAHDVLGSHLLQRLSESVREVPLRPCRDPAEELLDLRVHLCDRGVVRAGRRQRPPPHPARSIDAAPPETRWGLRWSRTTPSPLGSAGTNAWST